MDCKIISIEGAETVIFWHMSQPQFFGKKIEKEIYPKKKIDQSFTNYHMTPGPTRACHVPACKN